MKCFRTALVGFGNIAAGLAEDTRMAKYFRYSTHAQVLTTHPGFAWGAVVDNNRHALTMAKEKWHVENTAASVYELAEIYDPEILVLATPPAERVKLLEAFANLRAIFVEKPLANTLGGAEELVAYCAERDIDIQVNFFRRGDCVLRRLAAGGLAKRIGGVQVGTGYYCRGLLNNGCHVVDLVRMLLGEPKSVQALAGTGFNGESPLNDDFQFSFNLLLHTGAPITLHPLYNALYRENGLDIWAERGRLSILQEGLGIWFSPLTDNRALTNAYEVASDQREVVESGHGKALFNLYQNMYERLLEGKALWSDGWSALRTMRVIEAAKESFASDCQVVST